MTTIHRTHSSIPSSFQICSTHTILEKSISSKQERTEQITHTTRCMTRCSNHSSLQIKTPLQVYSTTTDLDLILIIYKLYRNLQSIIQQKTNIQTQCFTLIHNTSEQIKIVYSFDCFILLLSFMYTGISPISFSSLAIPEQWSWWPCVSKILSTCN